MSEKNQASDLQGTPPSPPPCATGCGFFGSPSTMNMCSKCYRDAAKAKPASPSPADALPSTALSASAPPVSPVAPVPSLPLPPVPAVPPPAPPAPAHPAPRKQQKNTSRCFLCRKKVGLTGFKCHCGYVYCSVHRYSEAHDCDYDYQTSGRKQLEEANPVVIASKLDKI